MWLIKGGSVFDEGGVEHHDVGIEACGEPSSTPKPQVLRGLRRKSSDGVLERDEPLITHVSPQ
jgi:hypothetical protein